MSNSGGRAEAVCAALRLFRAAHADYVIHLGDIGGRHVLDALGNASAGVATGFVWGDKDTDKMGLMRYGNSVGVDCLGLIADFDYAGKRVAALHGQDRKLLRRLIDEQQHDLLLVGHELAVEDYTIGRTRVLNPGPLHGGTSPSALLFDVESGKLKLLPI